MMTLTDGPIFGLGLNQPVGDTDALVERLDAAEEAGYDFFSVMDHPYAAERYEAYSLLSFALGRTDRIAGYVGVTNLPLRPAPVLARTLSSIGALSGNRLAFGIGSGGFWDRISEFGVSRRTPREAVDAFEEAIRLVRALTGGPGPQIDFAGRYYQVAGVAPAAVPTPPIWTGAGGPRALAITGRLADGWIPPNGADWRSPTYLEGRAAIDRAAAEAGRDPARITAVFNVHAAALTDTDIAQTRGQDGRWRGGSARQWVDELATAVTDYGATGFNTTVVDRAGHATVEIARRFAAEVVPAVRAAVS